jgi:hypothetical protein
MMKRLIFISMLLWLLFAPTALAQAPVQLPTPDSYNFQSGKEFDMATKALPPDTLYTSGFLTNMKKSFATLLKMLDAVYLLSFVTLIGIGLFIFWWIVRYTTKVDMIDIPNTWQDFHQTEVGRYANPWRPTRTRKKGFTR